MKTQSITKSHMLRLSSKEAICAGMLLAVAASASAQNLFVSDYGSQITEITPGGVQSTYATGMDYPYGIAFDSSGDLFVANSHNNAPGGAITEITHGGTTSTFATGIDTVSIAVNNSGNVFAADYHSGIVYKYSTSGVATTFATGFSNPISMTLDNAGDLFVGAGYGNNAGYIMKITPTGTESLFASGLTFPGGMVFNSLGNLLVSSQTGNTIYQFTPGGVESTYATLSASGINGLAFDSSGDLYAATGLGKSIVEITPGGTQSVFATISTGNSAAGLAFQPVPEPSTLALAGIGGLITFTVARRRKMR